MRDSAARLAVDDHGIHLHAVIVQREIAQDADLAGFDIDLDLGHMTSIGISEVIDAEGGARFQSRIEARWEAIARPAAQGPRELGTTAESPATTVTSSGLIPNSCAQICASAVTRPWPIAEAPVRTDTRPVPLTRTSAISNGPRPVPFKPCARPMPR